MTYIKRHLKSCRLSLCCSAGSKEAYNRHVRVPTLKQGFRGRIRFIGLKVNITNSDRCLVAAVEAAADRFARLLTKQSAPRSPSFVISHSQTREKFVRQAALCVAAGPRQGPRAKRATFGEAPRRYARQLANWHFGALFVRLRRISSVS
jgi:hypothetical protein